MSLPVKTGLADGLVLPDGYTIRFTAVDPVTGALVSGVKVSSVSVLMDESTGAGLDQSVLNPVLLHVAV